MEKNLPDQDPFEEYVRRTFDELDEEPSAEMWSKIDVELRPVGRKPVGFVLFFQQKRWLMAACLAGLLVGGVFGWQFGRFSMDEKMAGSAVEKKGEKQIEKPVENSSYNSDEVEKKASQKNDENVQPGLASSQKNIGEVVGDDADNGKKIVVEDAKNGHAPVLKPAAIQPLLASSPSTPATVSDVDSKNGHISTPVLNRLTILEALSEKPPFAVFSSQKSAPVVVKIQPEFFSQKPADRFASAWLMPVRTHEKPRGTASQPGPGKRPLFVNRPQKESISAETGLSIGKKWDNGLSFETGLSLRRERSLATHEASFKFSESTAGQSGSRQFDYDLTTYGGSVSVSYRVEEVNPGSQIGPTEQIGLQIMTIERVKTLRVPLLFGFQKQAGRWQFGLKTGPVAQILLKNELEIKSGRSIHPRLRTIAGRSGWAISQQQSQRFRTGFQTAATVGFRVSEKIGLMFEPTFMGDFGSRVVSTGRLPERFSTGLKLGTTVWF